MHSRGKPGAHVSTAVALAVRALDRGAYYLTSEPRLTLSVIPADLVHHIPADDT